MKTESTTENDWPSESEQRAYWEKHDIGGNVLPDRVLANEDRYNDFLPRRDSRLSERLISRDRDDRDFYDW